jgi:hypothetical protein
MKARAQRLSARSPLGRSRALLVLGLLAGLFGMHALAPGGLVHEHAAPRHRMTLAVGAHDGRAADQDSRAADHQREASDHDSRPTDHGSGHAQHSDPNCASGAVNGAPTLPGLMPDPVPVPEHADIVCAYALSPPDSARAPPSLAELQLLRI